MAELADGQEHLMDARVMEEATATSWSNLRAGLLQETLFHHFTLFHLPPDSLSQSTFTILVPCSKIFFRKNIEIV